MTEQTRKLRTVEGRVVSNKMDKTVTVLIERQVQQMGLELLGRLFAKFVDRSH